MTYTLLMTVALTVSYILMFGLVKFSESIISWREFESAKEDSPTIASET